MSEHRATVTWQRTSQDFSYEGYNREHDWTFDGGIQVRASAAPTYRGKPEYVDPEEALVAALSSCHMLTFLAIAARRRFVVDTYEDDAIGHLDRNAAGKLAVTRVTLSPRIRFGGDNRPTADELAKLHALAHEECFIANSVLTEVTVKPIVM
jgi:organic hydroperoxide reductase OsmC/OhrA